MLAFILETSNVFLSYDTRDTSETENKTSLFDTNFIIFYEISNVCLALLTGPTLVSHHSSLSK